jgi:hypothetical protein
MLPAQTELLRIVVALADRTFLVGQTACRVNHIELLVSSVNPRPVSAGAGAFSFYGMPPTLPGAGVFTDCLYNCTLRCMARAKGVTPVSNFRIPPDLKAKAQEKAESEGRSLTDVVVDYLREYTRGGQDG